MYWVYLHLFTAHSDLEISKRAMFKAYSLNPSNPIVIACFLVHYYTQKDYAKFF